MIREWWVSKTQREQLLVGILAAMTVLVTVVFGVLSPIMGAKADAREALQQATLDRALVERAIGSVQAATNTSAGPAENIDTFRADVTRAAQQRGLSITRLQSGDDGSLQLVFSDATPDQIYVWAWEVSAMPGGQTVEASLTGRGQSVQAAVRLQGTMP